MSRRSLVGAVFCAFLVASAAYFAGFCRGTRVESTSPLPEIHFAPGDDIRIAIVKLIGEAKSSIRRQAYGFYIGSDR